MRKLLRSVLGSPILWGGLISFIFYWCIHRGMIANELVIRYTAGHPVEYITVIMFFIGMVGMVFRLLTIRREWKAAELGLIFPPFNGHREDLSLVNEYLQALEKASQVRGVSLLISRLSSALSFLKLNGAPGDLEQELRYLSEEEAIHSESHYGMVKMFIWAIPILGFLGTVIGITQALGNLNLTELEATSKNLADGLQVAFDTTALALSLVFILYFFMFFVRNRENSLFQKIDLMVEKELRGRFEDPDDLSGSNLGLTDKLLEKISNTMELMAVKQTDLLAGAIEKINGKSENLALNAAKEIENGLAQALAEQVAAETKNLIDGSISPLVSSLRQNADDLGSVKRQMLQEEKLLEEILRAMGEISRLENVLNGNLAALRESGYFEEAVNTLSAAVVLLNNKSGANLTGSALRFNTQSGLAAKRSDDATNNIENSNDENNSGKIFGKSVFRTIFDQDNNRASDQETSSNISESGTKDLLNSPENKTGTKTESDTSSPGDRLFRTNSDSFNSKSGFIGSSQENFGSRDRLPIRGVFSEADTPNSDGTIY